MSILLKPDVQRKATAVFLQPFEALHVPDESMIIILIWGRKVALTPHHQIFEQLAVVVPHENMFVRGK